MPPENDTTCLVQRMRDGDESARSELITYAYQRLRRQSRMMLRGFSRLRAVEQTDDVLNESVFRLHLSLKEGQPLESGLHFWNRATFLIQRSLVDLARKHQGRHGKRPKELTGLDDGEGGPLHLSQDGSEGPQSLDEWAEFHEQVGALPEKEREMFGLRWYGGLSHEESADILGVSEREVKRRWQSARRLLAQYLAGERPL